MKSPHDYCYELYGMFLHNKNPGLLDGNNYDFKFIDF